jgi:type IV secretion system protein VirD4
VNLVATASGGHPHYAALIAVGLLAFAGYVLYSYLKAHNRIPWANAVPTAPAFVRDPYARHGDIRHLLTTTPTPGRVTYARFDARHYLETRDGDSLLVIGGPGSGKTTGVLGPAVRAWEGPAMIVSTKPDLMAETAPTRPHSFVVELDATESQLQILGWSPLDAIREVLQTLGPDQAWTESIQTADAMTASLTYGDAAGSTFWRTATAGALAPLLHAASITSATDVPDLIAWIKRSDFTTPLTILKAHRADQASHTLTGLTNNDPGMQSRITTSLRVTLQPYDDPNVLASTTMRGRFRPSMLLDPARPRASLYLLSDARSQRRHAPYFLALLDEVTRFWHETAGELSPRSSGPRDVPPDRRLLLAFDDAATIAAIPDLDMVASNGANDGITVALSAKDLDPLRASLGDQTANAVINNFRTRVLTRGLNDTATLQLVNELIGQVDTWNDPVSPSTRDGERRSSTARRNLLSIAELRELPTLSAVVVTGSEAPIRAQLLDRTDFTTTPPRSTQVSSSNPLPSALPEPRWPFQPR